MSKYLAGIAALTLLGAATISIPASATEPQVGATASSVQLTEVSAQRRHVRRGRVYARRYVGPRRYYGPGPAYGYYDDYPYGYYRPAPFVSFGIGPFGFWF
jgi:hypothetical protein